MRAANQQDCKKGSGGGVHHAHKLFDESEGPARRNPITQRKQALLLPGRKPGTAQSEGC